MQTSSIVLTAAGMGLVTAALRFLPFVIKPKVSTRPLWTIWVRYLPVAVLSAVVVPAVLAAQEEIIWGPISLPFLASLPTLLIGLLTRSLIASVTIGVTTIALLRNLF